MAETKRNKDEAFNALYVYREQGYDSQRLEQYKNAIEFFCKAYQLNPDDKRNLNGRGKAKSKFSQFDGALFDAEMVLSMDDQDLRAQLIKSTALYEMGEFEDGLVNFHIGLKRRKRPRLFEIGAMQAEETIEDCIGRHVGPALHDFAPVIKKMEQRNRVVAGVKAPEDPDMAEARRKRLQEKQAKTDSVMCEKYLGRLAGDKKFLDLLRENPNLPSPNKKGSMELLKLTQNGSDLLKQRQEILRTRMPFYAVKYHEATVSARMKQRKDYEAKVMRQIAHEEALKMLERLRELRKSATIKVFLEQFSLALACIDKKGKKMLPRKNEFIEGMMNICALKFLEERQLNHNKTPRDNSRLICLYLGLPMIKETAVDGIVVLSDMPVVDIKKQIQMLSDRLEHVEAPVERVWIYHELGRYFLDQGKADLSRMFAKKGAVEAREINNLAWSVNAFIIIARTEILQRNKTDAKAALNDAYVDALQLQDESFAQYLEVCLSEVEDADFDELEKDTIEVREKAIVRMMSDTGLKGDMEYLFQRMAVSPATRRMSLMPGVKPHDRGVAPRQVGISAVSQDSPAVLRRSMAVPEADM